MQTLWNSQNFFKVKNKVIFILPNFKNCNYTSSIIKDNMSMAQDTNKGQKEQTREFRNRST